MMILISIFNINNRKELILINNSNTLKPPTKAPSNNLLIDTIRLSNIETDNNNMKSKAKFNNNTKSTYIFISSPN